MTCSNDEILTHLIYRKCGILDGLKIEEHPELQRTIIKTIDMSRKSFEMTNPRIITDSFKHLRDTYPEYDIGPSEAWNEDECGFRIGCLCERVQVVLALIIIRRQQPEIPDPDNRESSTLLGAANAIGDVIPPWVVFTTLSTESWVEIEGDDALLNPITISW